MKMLEPEQWRVLGALISLCGARARLNDTMKTQEVSPEVMSGLAERGLIVAKLDGEAIDLTPGLIKTHRRRIFLTLSHAGESYYWNDPHRVLRSLGKVRHGLSLTFLLGMVEFDDLTALARKHLLQALTKDDTIDLGDARQRWHGSAKIVLPGGGELWTNAVIIQATKTGKLYCERY